MSEIIEALPGVWFWEAAHPDWAAGDSWEETVRCWAIATAVGLVLVDPLVRDDLDADRAWIEVDRLAATHGPVAAIIRTLHFHHRSTAQASARFDVPIYARPLPRDDIPVHPFDIPIHNEGELLGGLVAHSLQRDDELALWIPGVRALLFSDAGQRRAGRFELCPEWWVSQPDRWSVLRGQMLSLAESLAPEHLLVCHGAHRLDDGPEISAAVARAAARRLPPFIDLDEAASRRKSPKLIDARVYLDGRSERAAFTEGHLAGATFLDFHATLSEPPGPDAEHGRHPLPSPERFASGLAAAGISDGDTVLAYDDGGGVLAARLVWLLRILGEDAALLSPVPKSWESGPILTPAPGTFTPRPWPKERFVLIDEVAARDPETVLLDARDPARYAGGPDPFEPRSGHIPGAVNVSARANVEPDGQVAAPGTLRERFGAAGITSDSDVISSCGSGVTACHNLLSLEAARLGPGRLYVGSFSEWSRDPSRAVATAT